MNNEKLSCTIGNVKNTGQVQCIKDTCTMWKGLKNWHVLVLTHKTLWPFGGTSVITRIKPLVRFPSVHSKPHEYSCGSEEIRDCRLESGSSPMTHLGFTWSYIFSTLAVVIALVANIALGGGWKLNAIHWIQWRIDSTGDYAIGISLAAKHTFFFFNHSTWGIQIPLGWLKGVAEVVSNLNFVHLLIKTRVFSQFWSRCWLKLLMMQFLIELEILPARINTRFL